MPQATHELRAKFSCATGGDAKATKLLEDAGFVLTTNWEWIPPVNRHGVSCGRADCNCGITMDEWDAIDYMHQEWDYGGVCWPREVT